MGVCAPVSCYLFCNLYIMVKYIDKDGNISEFTGTTHQEEQFIETLDLISGTFFEPREQLEVKKDHEIESKESESRIEETELEMYIRLLKGAKVKGAHLISDVERAKAKCIENNLL